MSQTGSPLVMLGDPKESRDPQPFLSRDLHVQTSGMVLPASEAPAVMRGNRRARRWCVIRTGGQNRILRNSRRHAGA